MRPELLNRLDGTMVFQPLARDGVREVARNRIAEALAAGRIEAGRWRSSPALRT